MAMSGDLAKATRQVGLIRDDETKMHSGPKILVTWEGEPHFLWQVGGFDSSSSPGSGRGTPSTWAPGQLSCLTRLHLRR